MKATTFDKRLKELEQRRVYRIASLADLVILAAWRQRGDPRTPNAEDVEWDPQSQREFLDIISVETDHLSELVTNLLDMSRIEAGNLMVSRTHCHLAELVQEAAKHAHAKPGDRLRLELPPDLPPLYVDASRIAVVLRNLIENAVKYGSEATPITVKARQENGHLIVRVEDEGTGIEQ